MKNIIRYSLFTTFLFIISLFSVSLLLFSFISVLYADEASPLDYNYGYEKFDATVGVDRENGRYLTYHYEFID